MNNQFQEKLPEILKIKGWFDQSELSCFYKCLRLLRQNFNSNHNSINLVEIGSYHGRSTIALGVGIKQLKLNAHIYAIDPHEGIRSGRFDQIYFEEPTYSAFQKNLEDFMVHDITTCIRAKSTKTTLNIPIHFLLIDGIHLFKSVYEDFHQFKNNLLLNSLIAFHDFHDDFPGVKKMVRIIMETMDYTLFIRDKTLIVLNKITCHE